MKKLILFSIGAAILAACGSSRVCEHNGEEVDCALYDIYTAHSEVEAQINASFDDDSNLTFEEEFALREKWVTLYNANPDSLKMAYELVGAEGMLDMMTDMRLKEYEYFKEKKVKRAELAEFMKQLDIKESEGEDNTLVWNVTNNSDKTIGNFQFKILYFDEAGEQVGKKDNYFVMWSADQLTPMPAEGEEDDLLPGSSVVMDFDKPSTGSMSVEITYINFVEEDEE